MLKLPRSFVLWTNVHIEGKGEAQCMVLAQLRNSEIGHSLSVVIPVVDGVISRGCQRVQRVLNCFLESRYLRQLLGEEADAWFGRKLNSKEGTKGDIRSKNDSDCKIQIPHSHHSMECFVGLRVHGVFCFFYRIPLIFTDFLSFLFSGNLVIKDGWKIHHVVP